MKHRDLIDLIEDAASAARTALIEDDDVNALAAAHLVTLAATALARSLYDDAAMDAAPLTGYPGSPAVGRALAPPKVTA